MITPEMIPHGLALIARKAWAEGAGPTNDDDWNAAIAAALNAWQGMRMMVDIDTGDDAAIKLPLPQETRDAD